MKLNITADSIAKIEKEIIKLIPIVQYEAKLNGIISESDWEKNCSEETLQKTILEHEDVPAAGGTGNMYNFGLDRSSRILHIIVDSLLDKSKVVYPSGSFYYPPTGYMPWHTNSNSTGTRVYITYADEEHQSFFRYMKDDKVITDWDQKGLNIREFQIPQLPEQHWHCVGSNCNRYSFGFNIY